MIRYGTTCNDILGSTEFDDFIFGFKGDDTFISSVGDDAFFGGRGNDDFLIAPQHGGAVVFIDGGRGYDTVYLARDPISMDQVGNKTIIRYDYDMTIVVQNVEEIVL